MIALKVKIVAYICLRNFNIFSNFVSSSNESDSDSRQFTGVAEDTENSDGLATADKISHEKLILAVNQIVIPENL